MSAGVTLGPAQLATVLKALGDAIAWRGATGGEQCAGCDVHPAGLCPDHAEDVARVAEYEQLERQLIDQAAEDDDPGPGDYDPGPEADDEGGMSEYRYTMPGAWGADG